MKFVTWFRGTEAWIYTTTLGVTALLTTLALQLWKADLSVPLTYRGDALPVGAHFKTVFEEGWYESQPRLGAPAGQIYHDFPTADNLNLIFAKIIRLFTDNWALGMNAYFLLGFLLIAVAAVWFLRRCGVSGWLTIALSTVYAIAPYHFIRGESHLWLASYYAVPLAMGLLVMVLRGERLWALSSTRTGVLRWLLSPAAATVLIVAILGTSSSYYSVFFLILLGTTGLFCLVRDRSWKRFWGAAVAGVVTVVVMVINMIPDSIYSWVNGQNPMGLERSSGEAEFFALKLSQLLLPWPGHRISALANLRQLYDAAYVSLGEQPALGIIGALGLVIALLTVAYLAFARGRRVDNAALPGSLDLVASLSGLVFVAFIFSTLGGLSTIISVFTSSIRGWNRMSILIAILCLAILGLVIDALIARSKRVAWRKPIAIATAAALLVVGFIDQTPGDSDREYAGNAQAFHDDAAYFAEVQDAVPVNGMVLVLPQIPFPESNAETGLLASDQLIPYLHTSTVRWSVGGIKGRPHSDWAGELEQYGLENVAALGAATGFSGVLIDRAASVDHGVALEAAIAESTGARPLVSPSDRFAFYSLDSVSDALHEDHADEWFDQATEVVTNPVIAYRAPGFHLSAEDGGNVLITNDATASFMIVNDRDYERRVTLNFSVLPPAGAASIVLPDGTTVNGKQEDGSLVFSTTLTVAPGQHLIPVTVTTASGGVPAEFTMTQPTVSNLDIVDLVNELK